MDGKQPVVAVLSLSYVNSVETYIIILEDNSEKFIMYRLTKRVKVAI